MSKTDKLKKDLLKNPQQYSAEAIAQAIKDGVVTLYELRKGTEGKFGPLLERQVGEILDGQASTAPTSARHTLPDNDTAERLRSEPTRADASPGETFGNAPQDKGIDINWSEDETLPDDTPQDDDTDNDWPEDEPLQDEMVQLEDGDSASEPTAQTAKTPSNKGMFRRSFSFHGRIRRLEYGITFIVVSIWMTIIPTIITLDESIYSPVWIVICLLSTILAYWILLAQGCKRSHDRGCSGWWQLIPFYPLVLLFGKGDQGENEYGDDPKN